MPQVSIVIVCMNNLKNLYPCLDSIKKYTTISYETLVVAYLFSEDNKAKLRSDYPWVTVIESDEIRGFSENNNLALRQAKGEYCFVVNDDTLMNEPVIDYLVKDFERAPENAAIVSPCIINSDGTIQACGRPRRDWIVFVLGLFMLKNDKQTSKYINGNGLFKSYNILGAAFLIKTNVFKEMGWFDEYYFFCPEDTALSTKLNEEGYSCYVNADVKIIHLGGMSGQSASMIQTATRPASYLGIRHLYSKGNRFLTVTLSILIFLVMIFKGVVHGILGLLKNRPNNSSVRAIGEFNVAKVIFTTKTPKEAFIYYYNKLSR